MFDTLLVEISDQQFVTYGLENENKARYDKQTRHSHSVCENYEHGGQYRCVASFYREFRVQVRLRSIVFSFAATTASFAQNFNERTQVRHHIRENH